MLAHEVLVSLVRGGQPGSPWWSPSGSRWTFRVRLSITTWQTHWARSICIFSYLSLINKILVLVFITPPKRFDRVLRNCAHSVVLRVRSQGIFRTFLFLDRSLSKSIFDLSSKHRIGILVNFSNSPGSSGGSSRDPGGPPLWYRGLWIWWSRES